MWERIHRETPGLDHPLKLTMQENAEVIAILCLWGSCPSHLHKGVIWVL